MSRRQAMRKLFASAQHLSLRLRKAYQPSDPYIESTFSLTWTDYLQKYCRRPAGSNSAIARVLAIPELLEQILLQLTTLQLFTIQRTSQTFQAVIKGSILLRRAMRLEYDPVARAHGNPAYSSVELLLDERQLEATMIRNIVTELREDHIKFIAVKTACPLCLLYKTPPITTSSPRRAERRKDCEALARPKASWRQIKLLRDPKAILTGYVARISGCREHRISDQGILVGPGEGTLGDLEKWVCEWMGVPVHDTRRKKVMFVVIGSFAHADGRLHPRSDVQEDPSVYARLEDM